jgi:hypothetical protein
MSFENPKLPPKEKDTKLKELALEELENTPFATEEDAINAATTYATAYDEKFKGITPILVPIKDGKIQ